MPPIQKSIPIAMYEDVPTPTPVLAGPCAAIKFMKFRSRPAPPHTQKTIKSNTLPLPSVCFSNAELTHLFAILPLPFQSLFIALAPNRQKSNNDYDDAPASKKTHDHHEKRSEAQPRLARSARPTRGP